MKTLIIYDSVYGNTEKIAKAVCIAFTDEAKVLRVTEVSYEELQNIDLLIVGSPTQGGSPTKDIQNFLNNQKFTAKGVKVASFDTRGESRLLGIFGYAADKIADSLQRKGGVLIGVPMGFYLKRINNPLLKEGEVERATNWAKEISSYVKWLYD